MNLYEFMRGEVAKITKKHEQLVKTAAFNASGWSFSKHYSRRISISNI
jgi:hypothetical protein